MDGTDIITIVLLVGIAVVLPLALGHPNRWVVAAGAAGLALVVPITDTTPNPAAVALAGVWLAIALLTMAVAVRGAWTTDRRSFTLAELGQLAAAGFGVVAASAFVCSRAGWSLLGIDGVIVELTAVHFTYAGVGVVTLAGATLGRASGARATVARVGMLAALIAPPVVATGFVTGHAVPQVGGAVLMTAAVYVIATLQLHDAVRMSWGRERLLLVISGVAPWLPMCLAIAWAASNFWMVPALSIADMARTHGSMNAVFVIAGLVARRWMGATTLVRTGGDAPIGRPICLEAT